MMHKGLVLASYGTAQAEARMRDIEPLAGKLAEALPDATFREAYLSAPVRSILLRQGKEAPGSLGAALASLAEEGTERVFVQPGLIVSGTTMEGLREEAAGWEAEFSGGIALGAPLLATSSDVCATARAIASAYPRRPGRALVLVGHGTKGTSDLSYLALRDVLQGQGRSDVLLGLLEGKPGADAVIEGIERRQLHSATLVPLMLAAGAHVARQLAGEDAGSWCSRLAAEGIEAELVQRGLGSLPAIRALFLSHALSAMAAPSGRNR